MNYSVSRQLAATRLYLATMRRCIRRYGLRPARAFGQLDDSPVFVVGSPRSGTSFVAQSIGGVAGFADLGEVNVLKARADQLARLERRQASRRLKSVIDRVQRWGLVAGLRAIEQTPESTFLMPAIADAYPKVRFVLMVRDGRDVVASLLERGWLACGRPGATVARATGTTHDDAGKPFGNHARFWVEPTRREEFPLVDEARRAAWAWRRYNEAAHAFRTQHPQGPVLEIRYEDMILDPSETALRLAAFLDADDHAECFVERLADCHGRSIGRWRADLTRDQLAQVEVESARMLHMLGYVRGADVRFSESS
jgi:hypothetical protein